MKKADLIFTNAIVLTMDEELHIYEPGAVVVKGNSIVDVGEEKTILQNYNAQKKMDCEGKVLMPGLVNVHTHVPMTLLRGLADDLKLDVWLMGYMMPVEREFVSSEFVKLGTKLACAEMIRSGVTCFNDMYYFEDDVAQAAADSGMRAVCGETVLKFPTPDSQSYEQGIEYSKNFIKKWKGHPLITPAIAPHAPFTCNEEILQTCSAIAQEYDIPLHIHISETSYEVEEMRQERGMPVVPFVKKQQVLKAKTMAAHCVHIDRGEMNTLKNSGSSVLHNPSSNVKLASGIADIHSMLELGLTVGIGTDGTGSNNDLDMFEEIRLAAFLSKVNSNDPTSLPAHTALLMGTRIGAKALFLDDITGSIEPGKRADLILVDINKLHNLPRFRRSSEGVYAQLVYAAKSTDVTDVMIEGNWVMRDKVLLTINEEETIKESIDWAKKIDSFLIEREKSILSKLIAIGGASQEESFEVQVKAPIPDREEIHQRLLSSDFKIIRTRHYREYDSYFSFDDPAQGFIRFREDHFIDENNEVYNVRLRLTHIGEPRKDYKRSRVLLSRSRYYAPANQSLRFYREYFDPRDEFEIEKDRLRFLVEYKNTEFFVNLDQVIKPELGNFLEVKSRTWSKTDADNKSILAIELLEHLGVLPENAVFEDYIKLIES